MNRLELINYITEQYSIEEEHPWSKYPKYSVFRHQNNKKWFAVIMNISKRKLGLSSNDTNDTTDILNVKCDPFMVGSLRKEKGFYPAYHMNKSNWISIDICESLDDDKIKLLLDISFELTK